MRVLRPNPARPTWRRAIRRIRSANPPRTAASISSNCAIGIARAGARRSCLLHSILSPLPAVILAVMMLLAPGFASFNAIAQADSTSETTIIRRAAPNEAEPATDCQIQESIDWGAPTWLGLIAIAALLSFLIGRALAPHRPTHAAVQTAIRQVFVRGRTNANDHSFPEASLVLTRAETEVLEALETLWN